MLKSIHLEDSTDKVFSNFLTFKTSGDRLIEKVYVMHRWLQGGRDKPKESFSKVTPCLKKFGSIPPTGSF